MQKRDLIGSIREDSLLTKADDAVEFDNSDMGLQEQFERVYSLALVRIES